MLGLGFRPFYLLAAAFAVVAIGVWLMSFSGGLIFGAYLQGVFWHSHEMTFGFLSAVLAGFLFTAVRNWTGQPTPTGAGLGAIAALWVLARVLTVTGPTSIAILVDVLFLPIITLGIAVPIFRSRNRRNYKVVLLLAVLSALHMVFHAALGGHLPAWMSRTSIFAFLDVLVILFALVGGRVIPAFTRNAVPGANPRHLTWLEYVSFVSLIAIAFVTMFGSYFSAPAWLPRVLLVIAAVAQFLRLALWQPYLTVGNPLLWMLPAAYSWLPVALFLRALTSAGAVMPGTWIHALAAGALSSLMMAMMMRSSLGHTGRELVASRTDMAAFLLLQLGAIARVIAGGFDAYRSMIDLSGALWALAFVMFLVRYAPMLVRPRIDGKPG